MYNCNTENCQFYRQEKSHFLNKKNTIENDIPEEYAQTSEI